MHSWIGPVAAAIATIFVALITNWAALRQYKRSVTKQLREEAHAAYITEEQLQAEFRAEMRKEMERLREEDQRRASAYRQLEQENSDLRRTVASLEIEIMKLRAQIEAHGIVTGAPAITGSRAETAARQMQGNS